MRIKAKMTTKKGAKEKKEGGRKGKNRDTYKQYRTKAETYPTEGISKAEKQRDQQEKERRKL